MLVRSLLLDFKKVAINSLIWNDSLSYEHFRIISRCDQLLGCALQGRINFPQNIVRVNAIVQAFAGNLQVQPKIKTHSKTFFREFFTFSTVLQPKSWSPFQPIKFFSPCRILRKSEKSSESHFVDKITTRQNDILKRFLFFSDRINCGHCVAHSKTSDFF